MFWWEESPATILRGSGALTSHILPGTVETHTSCHFSSEGREGAERGRFLPCKDAYLGWEERRWARGEEWDQRKPKIFTEKPGAADTEEEPAWTTPSSATPPPSLPVFIFDQMCKVVCVCGGGGTPPGLEGVQELAKAPTMEGQFLLLYKSEAPDPSDDLQPPPVSEAGRLAPLHLSTRGQRLAFSSRPAWSKVS